MIIKKIKQLFQNWRLSEPEDWEILIYAIGVLMAIIAVTIWLASWIFDLLVIAFKICK